MPKLVAYLTDVNTIA